MKKLIILSLILFSATSFTKEIGWEALGANPISCKPSNYKSFLKLMEFIESSMPEMKYAIMPKTEKYGYYSMATDRTTMAVWAESQDKCNFGLQASKIKLSMAVADAEFKAMDEEQKNKIASSVDAVFKVYAEQYNLSYTSELTAKKYKKMMKQYLPDIYKNFINKSVK